MITPGHTSDRFRSDSNDGRVRETGIFVGFVKGNSDPQKMGRLAVYIPELGGAPDDPKTWFTVGYASPFAGATDLEQNADSGSQMTEMAGTQKSYGFWGVPPDLNNQVLVCFVNGDTARGYWFACLYQQFMNHMVPALGLNKSTKPDVNAKNLPPVCEYNRKDTSQNVWDPTRPIFEPLYEGLRQQGLFTDPERGPATTGARRESPSKCFGLLSPRGNSIHIDDMEDNEFIRLRTRSGVQILIHETTGYIYFISKKGDSWMEISDEGIDMYTKRSINMRAEENINMHADINHIHHGAGAIHTRGGNHTHASETNSATEVKNDVSHKNDGKHTLDVGGSIGRSSQKILDAGSPQQTGAFTQQGGSNVGANNAGGATSAPNVSQNAPNGTFSSIPTTDGSGASAGNVTPGPTSSSGVAGDNGGTSATGSSGTATSPQSPSGTGQQLAFGDSIAHGVAGAGNLGGTYKDGQNPTTILGYIQNADPSQLKGADVILSSGLTNSFGQQQNVVQQQINALQGAGVNSITLLGTSDKVPNGANSFLQNLAQQNNINYQPLGQISGDGYHPASYSNIYNNITRRK